MKLDSATEIMDMMKALPEEMRRTFLRAISSSKSNIDTVKDFVQNYDPEDDAMKMMGIALGRCVKAISEELAIKAISSGGMTGKEAGKCLIDGLNNVIIGLSELHSEVARENNQQKH